MPEAPEASEDAQVEYVLAVGLYPGADQALLDLRDLTNPGPTAETIAGSAVLARGSRGPELDQAGGGSLAYATGTGAALGVVVDVLLTLPMVGTALGAAVGWVLGRQARRREVEGLLALLVDDLPVGAAALVIVVPAERAGEVRGAMHRARRTTGRLLEDPSSRRVARGLVRGDPAATEALTDP